MREVECERLQSSCDTVAGHVIPSVQVSISDRFATNVNSGFVELLHGYVHSGEDSQIYVSQRAPVDLSSCSRTVAKAESRTEEAREAASGEEGTDCSTKITSVDAPMQPMCTLENVDDLIMCTGYTPALDFIDPPLLETIGFDPSDSLQPLLLHKEVIILNCNKQAVDIRAALRVDVYAETIQLFMYPYKTYYIFLRCCFPDFASRDSRPVFRRHVPGTVLRWHGAAGGEIEI